MVENLEKGLKRIFKGNYIEDDQRNLFEVKFCGSSADGTLLQHVMSADTARGYGCNVVYSEYAVCGKLWAKRSETGWRNCPRPAFKNAKAWEKETAEIEVTAESTVQWIRDKVY